MRGFGAVQTCFAAEAQMDKLAALGIDPVDLRLRNALGPGDKLPTGQTVTGAMPVAEVIRMAAGLSIPDPEPLPRDVRLRSGAGNTTRGDGVKRGFAVGFKNIYSEGFDDYCTARVVLRADGGAEVLRGGRGGPGRHQRAPPGCARGARHGRRRARVAHDGDGRLGRLHVGVAHDLDGGRGRANRVSRRDRGAQRKGGAEVDVEREYRHSRTYPLDPETGQTTGERSHVAFACAAMRVVTEVDVDLGLTRIVWIGTAQDVGRAVNPKRRSRARSRAARAGDRPRADGDPDRGWSDHERELHRLLDPDCARHAAGRVGAGRGPFEPDAPYGVKGVGEPPTVVSTAAVLSALRDATGRELTRVPVKPDELAGL